MNDLTVLDAMLQRKSIRKFSNEKVNNEIVKEVINHVRLAPSSYNAQPWRFVLITNENLIKNLSAIRCCINFKIFILDRISEFSFIFNSRSAGLYLPD